MMPMNNPLSMIMQAMRGGNASSMLQQLASRNPQIGQALQMIQGKSPEQLRQMAQNMCAERGTTIEEVARSLGLK